MDIYTAIQNTLAQFRSLTIESIVQTGTLWKVCVTKGEILLEFEVDETIRTVCVLRTKKIGNKSIARFMDAFLAEIDVMEEDEDPINPPQD
jgi:hypothetical protein